MDISKYADYFHDGYVNRISHLGSHLSISLESSVIEDTHQIEDKKYLSESNTFKGTLQLSDVKEIVLGGKKFEGFFRRIYDDGNILDFQIKGNAVFLLIEWKNFPPKNNETDVSKMEIEAGKIEWIPDRGAATERESS